MTIQGTSMCKWQEDVILTKQYVLWFTRYEKEQEDVILTKQYVLWFTRYEKQNVHVDVNLL